MQVKFAFGVINTVNQMAVSRREGGFGKGGCAAVYVTVQTGSPDGRALTPRRNPMHMGWTTSPVIIADRMLAWGDRGGGVHVTSAGQLGVALCGVLLDYRQ